MQISIAFNAGMLSIGSMKQTYKSQAIRQFRVLCTFPDGTTMQRIIHSWTDAAARTKFVDTYMIPDGNLVPEGCSLESTEI